MFVYPISHFEAGKKKKQKGNLLNFLFLVRLCRALSVCLPVEWDTWYRYGTVIFIDESLYLVWHTYYVLQPTIAGSVWISCVCAISLIFSLSLFLFLASQKFYSILRYVRLSSKHRWAVNAIYINLSHALNRPKTFVYFNCVLDDVRSVCRRYEYVLYFYFTTRAPHLSSGISHSYNRIHIRISCGTAVHCWVI